MDPIVKQAMAKWPDVPHCYGWLGLDARGVWRMRDQQAQALGLAGDKIRHAALLGFINRNYMHDSRGCWYFQNGPQRVYVQLEATPYIARTDPQHGFIAHTGEPLAPLDCAWLSNEGKLLLEYDQKIAQLDDRDLEQCLSNLRMHGTELTEDQLLGWLDGRFGEQELSLCSAGKQIKVQRIAQDQVATRFGFVRTPQPDA
jgi:hypothetical protein